MMSDHCRLHMDRAMAFFLSERSTLDNAIAIAAIRAKTKDSKEIELIDSQVKQLDKIMEKYHEGFENSIEELIKCECSSGRELEGITLKIPIEKSDIVESTLKKAGYDIGTDAYYADPNKFVSVNVRPTKELEVRGGG